MYRVEGTSVAVRTLWHTCERGLRRMHFPGATIAPSALESATRTQPSHLPTSSLPLVLSRSLTCLIAGTDLPTERSLSLRTPRSVHALTTISFPFVSLVPPSFHRRFVNRGRNVTDSLRLFNRVSRTKTK